MSALQTTRLSWLDLPQRARTAMETEFGAVVVRDVSQSGGFSPGLASRLVLDDGRRVFAKAINGARNPHSPGLYRREIAVMNALPSSVPAPLLLWSYDDGDWVMLVLEDVEAVMPVVPWRPADLERVVTTLERMAEILTPSPIGVPSIVDDLAENFRSWSVVTQDPALVRRLDEWAREHLDELVDLESGWAAAATGSTMLHADLRADNILITAERRVVVVDWPYAVTGAPWVDMLLFLPSVIAGGGVDPEHMWGSYGPAAGVAPELVNAVLAAVTGDFVYQSLLPTPVNLPGLRAHQREKGAAALSWLRTRLR